MNNVQVSSDKSGEVIFYSTLHISNPDEVNNPFANGYFKMNDIEVGDDTPLIFNVVCDSSNTKDGHWRFVISFNSANIEAGKTYNDYKGTHLVDFYYGNEQPIHIWVTVK